MGSLPLHTPHPDGGIDAWHQVAAPGGYEWWYFDAEDPAQDIQIVAIFLEGFVFHPGYIRAFNRYLARPTRRPPPLPREYPCVYFAVYEKGRLAAQFMSSYPAGALCALTSSPQARLGTCSFDRGDDGSFQLELAGRPWHLTFLGPRLLANAQLRGQFTFRPLLNHAPVERTFLSRQAAGAEHRWVIASPLCAVEGRIELPAGDDPSAMRAITFTGRGYHDHNFGTGPLGPGIRRWMWGRLLLDDSVATFHLAVPRRRDLPEEAHLLVADAAGLSEEAGVTAAADWSMRSSLLLRYPRMLQVGGLTLRRPRLVDSSPFYLRLNYEAEFRGRSGTAFCEVAYPHRLRWPILGRMIEMSIFPADPPA